MSYIEQKDMSDEAATGETPHRASKRQRAIETTGAVDEEGRLHLDESLAPAARRSVRVILLFEEGSEQPAPASSEADGDEWAWLRAASRNPAFDFLRDPDEDIYSAEDGAPFEEKP